MIQFDYPSGGIGRKERKRYTFSGFRGVDASVAEINVDPIRAVESTNFVDRNGVLHKRYGWEQEYQFDAEINGFWRITLDGTDYTICYAGKNFYRLSNTNGWAQEYWSDRLVSRRTACYVQNDKAYFIGCGDLLVFRFDGESGAYKFFRVEDDSETYTPTTTAQILPEDLTEEGLHGQYVRDGVNLLTGWRKNTLVGRIVPEDSGKLVYRLDSPPTMDKDRKIYLSFLGMEYEFSCENNPEDIITSPTLGAELNVNDYALQLTPCTLDADDTDDYPDVEYDKIKEAGGYGEWVLQLSSKSGSAGLRWKREVSTVFLAKNSTDKNAPTYRAYTLYLVGDSGASATNIPVLRRYFKEAKTVTERTEDYTLTVEEAVKEGFSVYTITATKNEGHTNSEFIIGGNITAVGSLFGLDGKNFSITIKNGEDSATAIVEGKSTTSNFSYNLYSYATKTYEISSSVASESEILEHYSIGLPTLVESTQNLSLFSTGDKVTVLSIQDDYEKVVSFLSAGFGCTVEDFEGSIDKFGVLTINKWEITENSSTANVEVKFYVNPNNAGWISSCKYSTLYGVDGGADRLFVVNGSDNSKSNIIFFSEMNDFTYFPDNYTKAVGGNANEVQGFIRLANGSMAALKTLQGNEPTVFVFSGEYISGYYDADEKEPYMLPRFSTSGVSTTQGIIAPHASSNLADDSLFVSRNGVYALELSQGTDSQRFAKERSLPINNLLHECNVNELKESCGITHENKYYLAVKHYAKTTDTVVRVGKDYYEKTANGYVHIKEPNTDLGMTGYYEQEDCVYVADAHYMYSPSGAMSDAPCYEWYPLVNIPVRIWFTIDNELYFGTNDGRICKFKKDQYYDVKKEYYASATEIDFKKYSPSNLKSIVPKYAENEDDTVSLIIDRFTVDENADISVGDSIVFLSGDVIGIVFTGVDEREGKKLLNKELYIAEVSKGDIKLKYRKDDPQCLEFIAAGDFVAAVLKKRAVKASRTLPTFDFGMPDYLKTLESFTVTMNGVEGGYLLLDIYTRNNQRSKQNVKGQSHFNSLSGIQYASFNVPFQNSFTQKLMVRNFNYAIFKIYNETPVDCSVASISVLYKYNRASGGIK